MLNYLKSRYKNKTNIVHDIILFLLLITSLYFPIILVLIPLILLVVAIFIIISNNKLLKQAQGNGIIYGSRGKGKGLLLNYLIRKDKTRPFCNVEYGNAEILPNISEYLNSINPNVIDNFINNDIEIIEKNPKFEGRNVYIDDVNVYLPNWSDSQLKKKYPSLPCLLAINRHLYDAHCIITTQDRERPYKILKELQGDFSIKAIKTYGFGFIWNCIPLLRYFVFTQYIYHELPKAVDMLPFDAKALVNETTKHAYLTSGQAQKEVYEATNGVIRYGRCLQLKKHLSYDTRYFHRVLFGYNAPTKEQTPGG